MKRFNIFFENIAPSTKALILAVAFIATALIPNVILDFTENYSTWSIITGLLIPLGIYTVIMALWRRTGILVLLMLWLMILCAFQIVILFLFGNSIIATDMFTNLLTTNVTEATELLSDLADSIITVVIIYLPIIGFAIYSIVKNWRIQRLQQRRMLKTGVTAFLLGCLTSIPAQIQCEVSVYHNEVFPINVLYNMGLSLNTHHKITTYPTTSADFTYSVQRVVPKTDKREIYVYVIGEASRACNWSMYGYDRLTNPKLSKRDDIHLFKNCLTQSNTTHKSVPLMLSSVGAKNQNEMYNRKGIVELFNEVGFKTYFISNQSKQGAMIDYFASEADSCIYLPDPRYDMQLKDKMAEVIESDSKENLFIVLHCYGSHFSYNQRYTQEYSVFTPDSDMSVSHDNMPSIRNAYDNSVVYTDAVLNSILDYLGNTNTCSALLFCSDHGEDLMDDIRNRFLHASPTISYYQLHIPSFVWLSKEYQSVLPEVAEIADQHCYSKMSTHNLFHTLADMAGIKSDYVEYSLSMINSSFYEKSNRYYLDDHNRAVNFDYRIGIKDEDIILFEKHGITKL